MPSSMTHWRIRNCFLPALEKPDFSAKFKAKWYELDIGWVYLRLLSIFGLAKISYARS